MVSPRETVGPVTTPTMISTYKYNNMQYVEEVTAVSKITIFNAVSVQKQTQECNWLGQINSEYYLI